MTVLSQVLLGMAAAGLLWCAACAVFPWMLQLAFREMPAALLAAVSGRSARRRLVRLLRARHAAGREVTASLPQGEPYVIFALRHVAGLFRRRPVPVTPACARRGDVGREALRARAAHERYEREFAARGLEGYFRVAGPAWARFETRPESRG